MPSVNSCDFLIYSLKASCRFYERRRIFGAKLFKVHWLLNSQSVKTYLQKNMRDIVCFVGIVLVLWKASCLFLRAKRRRYLASLSPTRDALLLYKLTNYVEFGFLCHKALEFALFKGFAIPSISKLLQSTQHFCPRSVLKRYDDTDILSQKFVLNHVDSRRGSLAIRRLNFIHAQYKIPNADLLYTLCLLVLEPIRFTAKIEQSDWGCHAGSAIIKGAGAVPPLAKRLVYALLDKRILKAMGYPRQPYWLVWSVEGMIRMCGGTLVRWCLPPRPMHWSTQRIPLQETEEEQELYKLRYEEYKPSIYPNGYKIAELGNAPGGRVGDTGQGRLLCPLACFPQNKIS